MQRQTPSCVDISETMPVDSSTTGLFYGGLGVAYSTQKQTLSCVDIHETMPVNSSITGLFLGWFGVACSNVKTNPIMCGHS